jgi:hypothetical protein
MMPKEGVWAGVIVLGTVEDNVDTSTWAGTFLTEHQMRCLFLHCTPCTRYQYSYNKFCTFCTKRFDSLVIRSHASEKSPECDRGTTDSLVTRYST